MKRKAITVLLASAGLLAAAGARSADTDKVFTHAGRSKMLSER